MKDIRSTLLFPNRGIPKCFTNTSLISNLDNLFEGYNNAFEMFVDSFEILGTKIKAFKTLEDNRTGVKKATEPIQFIHSKLNNDIRIFSIPNPLVQIPLYFYIYENRHELIGLQNIESDAFFSKSSYYVVDDQIVKYWDYETGAEIEIQGSIHLENYNEAKLKEISLIKGKYYSLKLDISNFYDNIYSHSISWGINDENIKKIAENLDVVLRASNRNETKGIIIGPYTSSMFAEIILSKVDSELIRYLNTCPIEVSFSRYSDDYVFYCDSEEFLKSQVKPIFESLINKYKLYINSSKTKNLVFPFRESNSEEMNFDGFRKTFEAKVRPDNAEELIHIENELSNFLIDDIEDLTKSGGNLNYFLVRLLSWMREENSTFDFTNKEIIKKIINYFINLSYKYHYTVESDFEIVITLCKRNNDLFNEYALFLLNKYKTITVEKKETHLIWTTYFVSFSNLNSTIVYDYFKMVLTGESVLSQIIAIDNIKAKYFYPDFIELLKDYFIKIENEIKQYNHDIKNISWHTKYWLLFYTNEVRWFFHDDINFANSIISKVSLNNYDLENRDKKFNLFKKMKDLNIMFFEKYIGQ